MKVLSLLGVTHALRLRIKHIGAAILLITITCTILHIEEPMLIDVIDDLCWY